MYLITYSLRNLKKKRTHISFIKYTVVIFNSVLCLFKMFDMQIKGKLTAIFKLTIAWVNFEFFGYGVGKLWKRFILHFALNHKSFLMFVLITVFKHENFCSITKSEGNLLYWKFSFYFFFLNVIIIIIVFNYEFVLFAFSLKKKKKNLLERKRAK